MGTWHAGGQRAGVGVGRVGVKGVGVARVGCGKGWRTGDSPPSFSPSRLHLRDRLREEMSPPEDGVRG